MSEQADGIVKQAKRLIKHGQHQEAIALLDPWLAENSDDASGWAAIGAAYFGLQNWTGAEMAAREVVRLRPQIAREWCNLGTVLRKSGQHAKAEQAQKRALELDPGNARAKVELEKARGAGTAEPAGPDDERSRTSPHPARKLVLVSLVGLSVLVVATTVGVVPRLRHRPASSGEGRMPVGTSRAATTHGRGSAPQAAPVGREPPVPVPLTPPQMVREGRRLYDERRYTEALVLFEEAGAQGSNDGMRWADSCRKRMEEQRAGEIAAAEAAKAAGKEEQLAKAPDMTPPAAVQSQAIALAKAAVREQIVVSLKSGARGERFLSASVSVLSAQVTKYHDVVPVWTGSLSVSGVVQIPTVLGAGNVWKDYYYRVVVEKPRGQGRVGDKLIAKQVSLAMR